MGTLKHGGQLGGPGGNLQRGDGIVLACAGSRYRHMRVLPMLGYEIGVT